MTATARRRPITGHPAFAPLIAAWFAAFFGLTVAVLPTAVLERSLATVGLGALTPLALPVRAAASALAAAIGALLGYGLARAVARHAPGDPRPLYDEVEQPFEDTDGEPRARRPLHVREELADGFAGDPQVAFASGTDAALSEHPAAGQGADMTQTRPEEGFMILTPQPVHPPRPAPDLEALLDQFDSALDAFHAGERTGKADPVQAFVAQQTGVSPAPSASSSPLGGLVPDHQAELRAALDKLARSQRGE